MSTGTLFAILTAATVAGWGGCQSRATESATAEIRGRAAIVRYFAPGPNRRPPAN